MYVLYYSILWFGNKWTKDEPKYIYRKWPTTCYFNNQNMPKQGSNLNYSMPCLLLHHSFMDRETNRPRTRQKQKARKENLPHFMLLQNCHCCLRSICYLLYIFPVCFHYKLPVIEVSYMKNSPEIFLVYLHNFWLLVGFPLVSRLSSLGRRTKARNI